MTMYHVYADDGFETAHESEDDARRDAQEGARRRPGVTYCVVATSNHGLTGGGRGTRIATYRGDGEVGEK